VPINSAFNASLNYRLLQSFPKGSTVEQSADQRLAFQIKTRHTTITFRRSGGGMEALEQPIGMEAERIFSALRLPKKVSNVQMLSINIEITATQNPFSRHSRQAKAEAVWIERLKEQIEKDFSWNRLRALYAGA
jgi:hypothetical protein